MIIELKQHPEILRVILAASPKYKKHKAFFNVCESTELNGTYWDGGSRSTYTAVRIADRYALGAPQFAPPQFGGPQQSPRVVIPAGVAIVATGTFRGATATASVYICPADAAKLLPA